MNEIYGVQEDEAEESGEETEDSEPEPEPSYEAEHVEAQPAYPVSKPGMVQQVQQESPEEFKPEPLKLKQPIERLKNPNFSSEKDVQEAPEKPTEEQQGNIVEDVEKGYGQQFEHEQKSREAQELEEFSEFLKSRKPEDETPKTEKEKQLVAYINKQVANGVREIDIKTGLQKIGWNPDILGRVFNIARSLRIKEGKIQSKKYGVDFM